jgi:hypothetical protein
MAKRGPDILLKRGRKVPAGGGIRYEVTPLGRSLDRKEGPMALHAQLKTSPITMLIIFVLGGAGIGAGIGAGFGGAGAIIGAIGGAVAGFIAWLSDIL